MLENKKSTSSESSIKDVKSIQVGYDIIKITPEIVPDQFPIAFMSKKGLFDVYVGSGLGPTPVGKVVKTRFYVTEEEMAATHPDYDKLPDYNPPSYLPKEVVKDAILFFVARTKGKEKFVHQNFISVRNFKQGVFEIEYTWDGDFVRIVWSISAVDIMNKDFVKKYVKKHPDRAIFVEDFRKNHKYIEYNGDPHDNFDDEVLHELQDHFEEEQRRKQFQKYEDIVLTLENVLDDCRF